MQRGVLSIIDEAQSNFRRTWPQLAVTAILYKVVAFAVLTPLLGLLLRLLVSTSGSSVVADEEILFFLLRPLGLAGLVVFGGVSLAIVALEQACLMVVAFGAAHGRRVQPRAALYYVKSRWRSVLSLAARITARALLISAPFLAAAGAVYLWLLTEFDINFYLSQKPREWWIAVALMGSILALLVAVLVYRALGWLMSLPMLMFEQVSPREALRRASGRVRGQRREAAVVLVGWGASALFLSWSSAAAIAWIGRTATPWAMGSMSLLVPLVFVLLVLWLVSGQVVTFVNGAGFAVLVTAFYRRGALDAEGPGSWRGEIEHLDEASPWKVSRRAVVGALTFALAAGVGFAAFAVHGLSGDSDAQITAHRGASMWAPENTLAAVQRALDDGADWVEIDVQESVDGRVVVVHDSDFMKLAGVPTKVWEATYDELLQIDIGSSFAPEFSDQRTPTLDQVLELARDRGGVNIELKYYGHDESLEQRVVDIVEAMGMQDQVVVMSLKYDAVLKVRAMRPDWTLGLLTAVAIGDLTRLDADFLAVNTGLASRTLLRNAHASGKEVLVWTVNDPLTAYAMISRGVDGVITDDPAMVRRVLAFYDDLNGVERLLAEVAILIGTVELDDEEPEEIG